MIPGLEVLPISLSRDVPAAREMDLINDATRIANDLEAERGPQRIPGFVSSNGLIAWAFLQSAAAHVQTKTPTFCEWGSGIGIVTSMAKCRGWTATGIEIEPRLIDTARTLASSHGIDVAFHQCSYKPDSLFDHDSSVGNFDTGLGFSLFDFDVIYAYLWPAESLAVTTAIAQHARDGTIFLRYGGGVTCDALRVNRVASAGVA